MLKKAIYQNDQHIKICTLGDFEREPPSHKDATVALPPTQLRKFCKYFKIEENLEFSEMSFEKIAVLFNVISSQHVDA